MFFHPKSILLRILSVFPVLFALQSLALAGSVYQLERGDPDRKAVLNALRPAIEAQMRGPVEFVVSSITVENDWAFAVVEPQRPGGRRINPANTAFSNTFEYMDGFTTFALLKFQYRRWNLVDHVIGPTDVAWSNWGNHYGSGTAIFSSAVSR